MGQGIHGWPAQTLLRMENPPLFMITLFQVQLEAAPRKLSLAAMVADNCRWSDRQETGSHSLFTFASRAVNFPGVSPIGNCPIVERVGAGPSRLAF